MKNLLKVLGWITLILGVISLTLSVLARDTRYLGTEATALSASVLLFSFAKVIELLERIANQTSSGISHRAHSEEEDNEISVKITPEGHPHSGREIAHVATQIRR